MFVDLCCQSTRPLFVEKDLQLSEVMKTVRVPLKSFDIHSTSVANNGLLFQRLGLHWKSFNQMKLYQS